jgi:hypothetical protein
MHNGIDFCLMWSLLPSVPATCCVEHEDWHVAKMFGEQVQQWLTCLFVCFVEHPKSENPCQECEDGHHGLKQRA